MRYCDIDLKCVMIFFFCSIFSGIAQQTMIKGKIVDAITNQGIENVRIKIKESNLVTMTNHLGEFNFKDITAPYGEQILVISGKGYFTIQFPITINEGEELDLDKIDLNFDFDAEQKQIGVISLLDAQLNDDQDLSYNMSGILNANRDVFINAAAFDFSPTFFRLRGLGNENSKVLINGIEMNKLFNGRPQWNNWGGLNDILRNQELSYGLSASDYTFGDLLGVSNITMRASKYRKGSRLSYATSNRSYEGRVMGTYHSGTTKKGWAFSVSMSRRYGHEGFIDGTLYDSNSFFASIEKKLNKKHSINLTGFYTPNRRGKSTAITEEVYKIRGNRYNPNWGYQGGEKRNSREQKVKEPVIMLNHYWDITSKTSLNTNIAFQKGRATNSRIDTGGGDLVLGSDGQQTYIGGGRSIATNPVHPDNLPSSFLTDSNSTPLDYQNAFLAQQKLVENGQISWDELIETNQQNTRQGNNATYILYEDVTNQTQLMGNMIFNTRLNPHFTLNAVIDYKQIKNENFAEVKDLLGGNGFLDVDLFALSNKNLSSSELLNRAQSDLQNPNRIVGVGDRYDYNYEVEANTLSGFLQGRFTFKTLDFFVSGRVSQTSYQRDGLFENGYFPGNQSLGKSELLNFTNYGVKTGVAFKINGRHSLEFRGTYFTKPPIIRNSFSNTRQNNTTVAELLGKNQESEKNKSVDIGYIFRSSLIKARATGYYTKKEDATNISFFFTQAISGSDAGFVQEILTDIDKLYVGGELGIEYQITPTIKIKTAAGVGKFLYDNNPDLILTSTNETFASSEGVRNFGKSALKGYHLAVGPQRAAQLGFEYRDPDFWWFGTTANYFSNAYINISPFARTSNFYQDSDGLPFNDYDPNLARKLLQQEEFDDYVVVNVIGGKSWRVGNYTLGFFASVNNILNQQYKTGGFEQSRNANYRKALEESSRETPVFGPKYFFGFGTTYYINTYIRF